MKRLTLTPIFIIVIFLMSGCLVEEELPDSITPHHFATATPDTPALPTIIPATNTPLLPFLGETSEAAPGIEATPTIMGVAGHPCPYRLTGDILTLYTTEPSIELSMGCPATADENTPMQIWPVTIWYQAFENGQVIWVSNRGWDDNPAIYVLRKNQIFTRHDDRFRPDWRPTATPSYSEENPDPFAAPIGLLQPSGAIEHLWRSDPDVFEDLGFATDTPIIMESEMLMLDYGELLRLPGLGLMFALKAGNPGTWAIYALPEE